MAYRILKEENNLISAEKYEEKKVNRVEVAQTQEQLAQLEAQLEKEQEALHAKFENLSKLKAELAEKLEIIRLADEEKAKAKAEAEAEAEAQVQEQVQ